jgi:hypothetical protein
MDMAFIFIIVAVLLVSITSCVYFGIHGKEPIEKVFGISLILVIVIIPLIAGLGHFVFFAPKIRVNGEKISSAYGITLNDGGDSGEDDISFGSYTTKNPNNANGGSRHKKKSSGASKSTYIKCAYQGAYTITLKNSEGESMMMKITIDNDRRMQVFTADNTDGEPSWELIEPNVTTTEGKE